MPRRVGVRASLLLLMALTLCLATAWPAGANIASKAGANAASKAGVRGAASLTLSPAAGPPTTHFTAIGAGFGAGERVGFRFDGAAAGSTTANASGVASRVLTVPASALPGPHQVSAAGRSTGRTAASAFTVRTNWTQWRFNAGNNPYNPYENLLGPSNAAGLTERWATSRAATIVAVDSGLVFALSGSVRKVAALDPANGTPVWIATFSYPPQALAVYGGLVYVSIQNRGSASANDLVALHEADGTRAWGLTLPGDLTEGPVVANGLMLVITDSTTVHARDLSGQPLWTYTAAAASLGGMAATARAVFLVDYPTMWAPSTVIALDRHAGSILWTTEIPVPVGSGGIVVGDPDSIYFNTNDQGMSRLDASTGEVVWSFGSEDAYNYTGTPTVVGDQVIFPVVGFHTAYLDSVDAATGGPGTFAWGPSDQEYDPYVTLPVVANGLLFVGAFNGGPLGLYAIDISTSQVVWSTSTTIDQPIVVNGTVYSHNQAFTLPGA